jgi:2-(1,2-epoxy-1,2-dihydrophenyl)acetyl-CoA isomerase
MSEGSTSEGSTSGVASEAVVRVERRDGWRLVTLNRPDKINAFNEAMHRALAAALVEAENDPDCRAILLTGAGRGFCAGQDLGDRRFSEDVTPDLGATVDAFYNPLVRKLRALPMPVVCAVHGVAAGAGANIALACDIVVAGRSAKFVQAFSKIGLVPDSGGTFFLPRLIGDGRARAAMMLAETIDGATAESWGMIWKAVEDDRVLAEAEALTARLATQPTQAHALLKQALTASAENGLDAQLDRERDLQREAGRTPDYREGVRAFLEKRAPNFTGRKA